MALTQQLNKPDMVNPVSTDLDAIRNNFWWIIVCAANGSTVIPGWDTVAYSTTSPQDFSKPDYIELTYTDTTVSPNMSYAIQIHYTWDASDQVSQMVIKFDDDTTSPSLETVTGGTLTITYDGDGNFTGATSA